MDDPRRPRSDGGGRSLILGGVRSGKSRLAERLAHESALPVVYVATARAGDAEMTRRIAGHRERRPRDWGLIEEPLLLAEVLARECAPDRCILVDCLTLWLTNWLMKTDESGLHDQTRALLDVVSRAPGRLIMVGNETSMGVVPLGALSRRFCDLAGLLHQDLAARCEQVILTVAGLPLVLKGEAA
ncbi:MAG: bifunctional adenosylcobinamide kinase/adenosylcobinamide-phosphate guanylyltransferase [Thiocapsa sp.]|uniref:bifunctional adenosylcobinamide kinase/adenosylcobinamide-phosphate guanylyltransferase n=1 Tax=Thiocapsa sp. TaxID=2024551 RepID=UPI001BCB6948|nr:bifunctional adenosylcobinamide kinase/adenosylcobinamide-phosphate guanylyltransferase [Thiocapsa sp.]QVL48375.1 MAG: bifunctional adenosylcobinamide kinase/adenosylcobinamide-phosphate guanylyltransferase [Thiocapsa sp.]